jgi:hypothetical protein
MKVLNMQKHISNVDISLKFRYQKMLKLAKKGYWRELWRYLDKITRKANIFVDLAYPDITMLDYDILYNDIEILTVMAYSRGVYTEITLTYVKSKRELTISARQFVDIPQ